MSEDTPLLSDYPRHSQVHVAPFNDAKPHVLSLKDACWCGPQEQPESGGPTTYIHRPINPVVRGHALNLKKMLVTATSMTELER